MKILHTVESYYPVMGGAQEVVRRLSELLVQRGHQVTVATRACAERRSSIINGVTVKGFEITGNSVNGITGPAQEYQDFVIHGDFDVVMSYAAQQWATDLLLPILERIPYRKILAPCGFSGLYDPPYAAYFAKLPDQLRNYNALIFHSDTYRDMAFCRQNDLGNLVLIPNGAAAEEFDRVDPLFRQRHGIDSDAFLLLTVGSHTSWKGHTESIQAYAASRLGKSVFLINGNTHGSLGCLPRDRTMGFWTGLRSWGRRRVRLLDLPRADLIAAYQAADLFVFPSNIECSPLVLFEAMASRTPFIASDVGNATEIAQWSGSGLVLPTHQKPDAPSGYHECTVSDLTSAIERLYHDPEERQRMAESGQQAWRKSFTWEHLVTRYEATYKGA